MKMREIVIHNFRSIHHRKICLKDYSLLVGPNNSGKSNTIDAIRVFYEDLKYDEDRDFPKFETGDDESWIEVEYELELSEFKSLREEYKLPNNRLRIRKYLRGEHVRSRQSNLYAYTNDGTLSDTLFYGARNISEAKLGDIIYIPAVSVVKEVTKLSGPSPLRNLLQFVISEISSSTEAYEDLKTSFERLNKLLKGEIVEGEDSSKSTQLKRLIDSINDELEQWQAEFSLFVRPMEPNDIIRTFRVLTQLPT